MKICEICRHRPALCHMQWR